MIRAVLVGLVVTLLAGCASAPVSYDFIDPGQRETRYDGFIAYAAFVDRTIEAAFEQALCRRLADGGHACTTMLHEAPPTRAQDAASRHQATRNNGAQATIVIELADTDSVSRRVIAASHPAYEVSIIDNTQQQIVARLFLESISPANTPVRSQAEVFARAIVSAIQRTSLLAVR